MSNPTTQRRIFLVAALLVGAGALGFVAFGNMGESLVYYWDPTQLNENRDKAEGAVVRLGGVVKAGTVVWKPETSALSFDVTDNKNTVHVEASGAPPQMFREGIGIVVEGQLDASGVFRSDRLMVKHSNEYKAPEEGVANQDLYKTVEGM
jgi:cytochrome c-type biogenesis protein CcmE